MEVHECVSFLVIDNDNILLEKRSMLKESDPGLITIPGGHIEQGECHIDALLREMTEELEIEPKSFVFLCSLYHPTSELQLIHYYVVSSWSGEIKALEADEVSWYQVEQAPVAIEADRIALSEYLRLINQQMIAF